MTENERHNDRAEKADCISEVTISSSLQTLDRRRLHAIENNDVHGVILAGGRSSRMGSDKALLFLGDRPLIQYAMDILRCMRLPIVISGSRTDLRNLAPVLLDMGPGQGPLSGICSALHALAAHWIVLLTVDMPFAPPSLVELMLDAAIECDAAAVLPSFTGSPYTFPCVLKQDLLCGLVSEYRAGRQGCLSAFSTAAMKIGKAVRAVRLESLADSDFLHHPYRLPIDAWLLNVNRPEDLFRAERWLEASSNSLSASGS